MTESLRRTLLWLGATVTLLAGLHHLDHVARGNHVGWPLIAAFTPFTPSLLIYVLLLGGLYGTARDRLGPRYWTVTAVALLLLVVSVHFNPDPHSESWRDIYVPYVTPAAYCGPAPPVDPPAPGASWLCGPPIAPPRAWLGVLALVNLGLLIGTLVALLLLALRAWRAERRDAVVG